MPVTIVQNLPGKPGKAKEKFGDTFIKRKALLSKMKTNWENIAFWIVFVVFMVIFIYLFATGKAFK